MKKDGRFLLSVFILSQSILAFGDPPLPNPRDFLVGPLGGMANLVGKFEAVRRPDGVHIVGLGGLVDQRVEQTADGKWQQVGNLKTPLPCAQIIHNAATRRRTK